MPVIDSISIGISELWQDVERVLCEYNVPECQKANLRGRYNKLQRLARRGATMQRIGLSAAKLGRIDERFLTYLKDIQKDEGKTESTELPILREVRHITNEPREWPESA